MSGDGSQTKSTIETELTEGQLTDLHANLSGELVLPAHESYTEVRKVWNGRVDYRPAMIVQCRNAADVVTAIEFARTHKLALSVRSGGHHPSGYAVAPDTLVIDCSTMTEIVVNEEARTVQVGPGVRTAELLEATQQHGLAIPTGSAGDVGIGGSTLGGGIGWIRRSRGLAIDLLCEVELVTSSGDVLTASEDEHADLFWALRGAGGHFGVVTKFQFTCVEVGPIVPSIAVFYPGVDAEEVFQAFRDAMTNAPNEVSTMAVYGHIPPMPMLPEELHGQSAVQVMGCYDGPTEDGMAELAPFRELADPVADLSEPMPYLALHQMGSDLFPAGRNYYWRSSFAESLKDKLLKEVLELGREAPSPGCGISVWPLGGKMNEVNRSATAFPWRDASYMLTVEANWDEGMGDETDHIDWAQQIDNTFRKYGAIGAYVGFPGTEETDESVAELCFEQNLNRLTDLKAEYDSPMMFGDELVL